MFDHYLIVVDVGTSGVASNFHTVGALLNIFLEFFF